MAVEHSGDAHPSIRNLSVRIVRRLSKSFTLDAELNAAPGFTMLLGPSGGGKTTLLNCIAGLERPDAGRIVVNGRVLVDSSSRIDLPASRRELGYVFQDLALFPHLTVEQNVEYGIMNLPAGHRRKRMMTMLESFRIAHLIGRRPSEISGGERQRTALARALVTSPCLLLLDEPLAALDAATKSKILDDLRIWNGAHEIPILYVTHSPAEAFTLGERVIVMESGRIIADGMPNEVLASPRHETIAQVVGFENVFDATVVSIDESRGTMLCRLDGGATELEVALGRAETGSKVRIAIRSGDIIVAAERPHGLSARNVFQGRVESIRREGVTVILMVEAGARFEVHLTPGALADLNLSAGKQTWLVIKTYSCNLVEKKNNST